MKSLRKGPSPAMVIAVMALAFALVGTAVAANDGTIYPKLTKSKVKKIAKKQATKQLKANVNNSHVNLADEATNAENLGGSPASDYQKAGLTPFTAGDPHEQLDPLREQLGRSPATGSMGTAIVNIQGSLSRRNQLRRFHAPAGGSGRLPTGAT